MKGSFISKTGDLIQLESKDISIEVLDTWESRDTEAIYPITWKLKITKLGIDIIVKPVLLQQEMDTRASTGIVYWEGAVDILGNRAGFGYVELTNYDLYPYGETDESTKLRQNSLFKNFK